MCIKYWILILSSILLVNSISSTAEPLVQHDQSMWEYESFEDEQFCLALNIYFESRDQDLKGQLAVGLVTINRVISGRYPNNICDVVWQKRRSNGKFVAQFSWTWDGKQDNPLHKSSWDQSQRVAESLIAESSLFNISDFTDGATHYHADYVNPYWVSSLTKTLTVGNHLFYK